MKSFKVLLEGPEFYDIMPYLIQTYDECKKSSFWWMFHNTSKRPETTEDYKLFVKEVCKYRFWARCEYEWLMIDWPPGKTETLEDCHKIINSANKIDAWNQIKANLDVVTDVFIQNIK